MTGQILRRLRPALGWAVVIGLLFLAWHLKHPLMFWLRAWETPLLLFTGIVGGGWNLRRPGGRGIALALFLVAGLTGWREAEFQADRAAVLAAGAEMRALGGHFVVGFTDFAALEPLAARGLIGGIYLTRRNLRGASLAGIAGEIARLQDLRRAAGLPPLIVAADQEGGEVSHLSPLLTAMPPLSSLVAEGPPATLAMRARRYGSDQGRELAALGVNLNFGPVVDLRPREDFAGDRLTRIGRRAIAADPGIVGTVARGYMAGLGEAGVGATLKHFPGLGRVQADTHFSRAQLAASPQELASDWLPFRQLGGSAAAMMLGHVVLPALDPDRAASHSRAVVAGLLRGEWGYGGLLITDDLNMGAVYGEGIGRVAAEALAAGVDLVLVSYDPDQYFRALAGAAEALRRGKIDGAQLAASRVRLAAYAASRRKGGPAT